MGRYSIRTLLLLVAVFALGVWWFQSGFRLIHRVNSPGHGEAFIYAQQEWWSGQYKIRIQYDPHPDSLQPETHLSDTIWLGTDSLERLGFETSVDSETGAWCLYDMADQQIVFLVMSQLAGVEGGIWHPGVHIGWARGFSIKLFRELKGRHPEISCDVLPGEKITEAE